MFPTRNYIRRSAPATAPPSSAGVLDGGLFAIHCQPSGRSFGNVEIFPMGLLGEP